MVTSKSARFRLSFLHPRYWLIWIGVACLWTTTRMLPFRSQLNLGRKLGRLLMMILSSRRKVAERNLELCFPNMNDDERQLLLTKNFESTGIALFETAIAWWWPDRRLKKLMTFTGAEWIEQARQQNQGVLLFSLHCLPLEIGARSYGMITRGIGVYRPHNNPVMEYLQVKGRTRSNKGLISKFKLKSAIRALKKGENIWYTTDQDFGRNGAVFVPFFAVPDAATITGTSTISRMSGARVMPFMVTRNADDTGYTVAVHPPLNNFPSGDDRMDTIRCNKIIEEGIRLAPDQYLWLHRRFKTRPNKNDPSLYGRDLSLHGEPLTPEAV
ncbi:LpxL/LpxP family Kdo(2)-lipid IV(A) lauroyl/palmitoleoyl acyltransferase [Endozoicomonas sp.]|uniref:LpxL/LpxP family Kdo(2)-lipid IV(A) lauroyl/palmitoleoyl acyltransferase n=1 Tax=Endozoicomonas sp. TaxID=1892382 RepID=UPI00288809D4|nr:LpxL/LpxP family Kdo(2)-lipid IV(A) lauroyl/palmitoleoyl acyltransferase [Endozoicomonas sp.]